MKKVRCAIYTRKSSEEGLDQNFNSLDAQREACAAYIESQKHEGWVLVPQYYDDGGLSGGNMERPALKELMHDIDEGQIDQIVVYKIDRLTRSLSDFAKLVDRLDKQEASFVSVTQSFNTATSMGRLTLNVLLSFAQFEREVTAERIRDKIAASKKKGMWMGGTVPLGYEPNGRSLTINETEATTIRELYELYFSHQTLNEVATQACRLGLRSKTRKMKSGEMHTGKIMTASQIHHILTNPLYVGYIRHGDKIYDGLHPAIIQPDKFEMVQSILKAQASKGRGYTNKHCEPSLLMGKLFDEDGERLTTTHTSKKGQRYRYYISKRLKTAASLTTAAKIPYWRLPANAFEKQIFSTITNHLVEICKINLVEYPSIKELTAIKTQLEALNLSGNKDSKKQALSLVKSITLKESQLLITLDRTILSELINITVDRLNLECHEFTIPFTTKRRGVEAKLIVGDKAQDNYDPTLIRNLAKANLYYGAIKQGKTFKQIANKYKISKRQVQHLIELAFISPHIITKITRGEQPVGLTSQYLREASIPSNWVEQEKLFSRL